MTSSFRDPSGFVFSHNRSVYRQINDVYKKDYELLLKSGLYKALSEKGYLVKHEEVMLKDYQATSDAWKIIHPQQIPFISYPYERCFSMLKDAALLTLEIQKTALEHNMSLKDASAFNIQFLEGKPILIDTLSFEAYNEGKPWIAYKQFVEHFLAPLYVMNMNGVALNRITSVFLDGIPIEVAASMLPFKARLNISLFIHIFAHAASQKKYSTKKLGKTLDAKSFSRGSLLGMINDLERLIKKIEWDPKGTQWEAYYEEENNNYNDVSFRHKAELVKNYLTEVKPKTIWDMGANTGHFSRIGVDVGANVMAFDIDYGALEKNYRDVVKSKEKKLLPLFCDLTNPTPATGWENKERLSLFQRGPADAVLALALIHHLAIPHNVPFSYLASCFSQLGNYLVVEFIDKTDSQVQILLANRKDIFSEYSKEHFEKAFADFFTIRHAVAIKGSKRILYLMEKK